MTPQCPDAVPVPFISLPRAPGLYGVSPLDGPMRVCAVLLSAQLPKGGVHDPGVKELGQGASQVSWVEGGWLQLHRVRCAPDGRLMCGHQGCCLSDMVGLVSFMK